MTKNREMNGMKLYGMNEICQVDNLRRNEIKDEVISGRKRRKTPVIKTKMKERWSVKSCVLVVLKYFVWNMLNDWSFSV